MTRRTSSHTCCALLALLLVALGGCVSVRYDIDRLTDASRIYSDAAVAEHFARMDELTDRIAGLAPTVDRAEARKVAEVALTYPMRLAERYRLTQPAITHNMLVNIRAKPRGLCIHWTEDLLRRLEALRLTTLDLYWGVAYPTRPFRLEHSSPVVTATDAPFETGLVLDGWRDSGRLYFTRIPDDKRYAWQRLHNHITDPPPGTARGL